MSSLALNFDLIFRTGRRGLFHLQVLLVMTVHRLFSRLADANRMCSTEIVEAFCTYHLRTTLYYR